MEKDVYKLTLSFLSEVSQMAASRKSSIQQTRDNLLNKSTEVKLVFCSFFAGSLFFFFYLYPNVGIKGHL